MTSSTSVIAFVLEGRSVTLFVPKKEARKVVGFIIQDEDLSHRTKDCRTTKWRITAAKRILPCFITKISFLFNRVSSIALVTYKMHIVDQK